MTSGADEPATFTLSAITAGLPSLTSKGDAVTYAVTDGVGSDTLTATADAGGANERVVFTLVLEEDGDYTFDLQDQIDHPDGSGDAALLALDLSSVIVATDFDGDSVTPPANAFVISVENDVPVASGETESATVQEDDLSIADGDFSDGIDEAGDPPTDEATGSVAALVTSGADEPATFTLSAITAGLPSLTSKGDAVTYAVTDGVGSDTLTATADAGGANERVVFTLVLEEDGDYTFDLQDQLDHPDGSGDAALLALDLSSVIVATDFDGDSVTPPANAFVISVENDVPVASGETESATVQEDDLRPRPATSPTASTRPATRRPTGHRIGGGAGDVRRRRAGDLHPVGHHGRPAEPDLEGRCGHLSGHRWRRLRHADGHRRCGRCQRAGGVHAGSGTRTATTASTCKTSSTILTAAATPPCWRSTCRR